MKNSKLTPEQHRFLKQNFRTLNEQELYQKLPESGSEIDLNAFADCLRSIASEAEANVFEQNLSEEELSAISGGKEYPCGSVAWNNCTDIWRDDPQNNCAYVWQRNIYGGNGFANCAATVENGSWCSENDACYLNSVDYQNMKDCNKAWR